MKALILVIVGALAASAAVDGVVTNQTTGKPQSGVTVTLIQLGSGMNTVGSVQSGADGKFTFPNDLQPSSPYLIEAQHQGVNYNRMLPPGSPGAGVSVPVYEASAKATKATVTQHMFLLEPGASEMVVSERIVLGNYGNVTYQDPDGTVKFWVPGSVTGPIQVRVQGPQGMPITRPADKGKSPNVYVIRYPIKPGETNIDVNYAVPSSGGETKCEGKILHDGGPVRFVAPSGVKLEGPFTKTGAIPGTSATAYTLNKKEFALKITGTGSLRESVQPEAGAGESDEGSQIDARKPLIYDRLPWVLSFSFAMLGVGFVLLYRRSTPARVAGSKR